MEIIGRIAKFHDDLKEWRHDIHAHPELGFEEQRTSDLVAQKLAEFGCEVFRGIGKTGVVGRLRAGDSVRSIGLRADMDCLPIEEATNLPYSSRNNGRMHACGHDGHTTMLLGAARYLAERAATTLMPCAGCNPGWPTRGSNSRSSLLRLPLLLQLPVSLWVSVPVWVCSSAHLWLWLRPLLTGVALRGTRASRPS
jgi:hypothetical protein